MKKYSILILFVAFIAQAQTFQVQYTQTMNLDSLNSRIEGNERMKAFMSEEMKAEFFSQMSKPVNYTLTFSDGKSSYHIKKDSVQEEEKEEKLEVGKRRGFRFRGGPGNADNSILFKNHETATYTKEQEYLEKTFLISGDLKASDWKITDTTKSFGDFTCTVATTKNNRDETVNACYTEDIPISEGPDDYYGLPGLVVEVQIGPRIIAMSEIKILNESTPIEEPSKGKKITQEKFDEIVKKQIEERRNREKGGGGGRFH